MIAPGPSRVEVLSSFSDIVGNRLNWMVSLQQKYGDVVRIPVGPRVSYGIFHPDLFRYVLVANAKNYWKGRTFQKAAGYLGKGLATSEGAEWQIQRRRMNPHFHREALEGLSQIIFHVIEKTMDRWEITAREQKSIDLSQEFQRLALEVVVGSLFGTHVPESEISEIIEAFKTALIFTTKRTMNPIDIPDWIPLRSTREFKKAITLLDRVVHRMIREEQEKPSQTLLSVLLSAQDPETGEVMTTQQIRDEIMTLFLGGTDTSGNTLSWVFYHLCKYPEIRASVVGEVDTVLGGRPVGVKDLGSLSLTKRVIDETLRLCPQNWAMSRDAIAADTIGGYDIPAGSTVFLGVYVAHRRNDFWNNPLEFDPNRFLPEQLKGRHPLCYIPFGGGQRKCIGYPFAMMEITFAISRILQRFEIEITNLDEIGHNPTWSLWPKPALMARIQHRIQGSQGVMSGLKTSLESSSQRVADLSHAKA